MDLSQRCFDLLNGGDVDALKRLLDADPTAADTRDASGVSLLMQALYRGHRDLGEYIAAKKNAFDIFEAASLGRLDRLQKLVADPAFVNSFSPDGFTALHFACFFGQPGAARLLISHGATVDVVAANPMKVMPLHSAASARNLEAVRLLLEHGASVNARQHGGWAAIHAVAQNGDRAIVDLLLLHGADPRAANDQGKTPGMVAREAGREEIAALLER